MSPSLNCALRFEDGKNAFHLGDVLQDTKQSLLDDTLARFDAAPRIRPHLPYRFVNSQRQLLILV